MSAGSTHTTITLYLVSHASGELIEMLARNAVAQLDGVKIERRLWKFVRNLGQVPDILAAIGTSPGYVLHSIAATDIREALEIGCSRLATPCAFSLEPLVSDLSKHFNVRVRYRSSARDVIDEEYYQRVEAMKYAIAHDDGMAADDLEDADVVLIGVSRVTKTPTCVYLASRGIKAANVPLVQGVSLPDSVLNAKHPLVVGLTIDPARLSMIRSARARLLRMEADSDYSDVDALRTELQEARRLYARRRWPVIDISNRSIERTADMIIALLKKRQAHAE
jgi:[pyruvate, water dikinase]-phosphate phosphotransferase / [pyruvate, water dikinase] kinase